MITIQDALSFYDSHYQILGSWILRVGKRETLLGDKRVRQCRFCGRRPPEATFRLKAHAVAESLGNKTLFTAYECDNCNQSFELGIENHFGNWSKPMRLLGRIRGKNGVPTVKDVRESGFRIENGPGGLNLSHESMDPMVIIDEQANTMTFHLSRDPYIPRAVFKSFVKFGLSIVPDSELRNFERTFPWISDPDHTKPLLNNYMLRMQVLPGPSQSAGVGLCLFRRANDYLRVPYMFLIVSYGCQTFQVSLPSREKNWAVDETASEIPWFPVHSEERAARYGMPQMYVVDLGETQSINDGIETIVMRYDERIPI
jgi:hypothetical protein